MTVSSVALSPRQWPAQPIRVLAYCTTWMGGYRTSGHGKGYMNWY